jgi:ABC-type branched-subunit amino acid transport system substrate-binding protein
MMFITYPGFPNEGFQVFSGNYKTRYNKDPSASEFQASAYDAFYMLAISMTVSDNPADKVQVKANLAKTQPGAGAVSTVGDWSGILEKLKADGQIDYNGAAGDQDFDSKGDVIQPIGVFVVKDGAFEDAESPCWTLEGECS